MRKTFSEYCFQKQQFSFLNESQLTEQELEILQFQVLECLYNSMSVEEKEYIEHEHQVLIQEFAFLLPLAANIARSLVVNFVGSWITSKLKSKSKEEEVENKEIEKNVKKEGGILSMIYKIIKTLGVVAFAGSLVFVGFQFDAIRNMFPFLVPFMDQASEKIGEFAKAAFMKVVGFFPWLGLWLAKKGMEAGVSGASTAYNVAKEAVVQGSEYVGKGIANAAGYIGKGITNAAGYMADKIKTGDDFIKQKVDDAGEAISDFSDKIKPQWIKDAEENAKYQRWYSPTPAIPIIDPVTGEKSYPIDTRTGLRHGDYRNKSMRDLENLMKSPAADFKSMYDKLNQSDEFKNAKPKLSPEDTKELHNWLKSLNK